MRIRRKKYSSDSSFSPNPPESTLQPSRGWGELQPKSQKPKATPAELQAKYEAIRDSSLDFTPTQKPVQAQNYTLGEVGDVYEREADANAKQVVEHINSPETVQRTEEEGEDLQMKPQTLQRNTAEEEDVQMKSLYPYIQRAILRDRPNASEIQRNTAEEEDVQMKPLHGYLQRMAREKTANSSYAIQRNTPEEGEDVQMKPLQRKPLQLRIQRADGGENPLDREFESTLNSAKRTGGQSLQPDLQAKMGEAMGADFSGVKVHTDATSDQLNQSIQAKAFTTGQDVFFKKGEYQPGSKGGQELIAHELTHVVQQRGINGTIQRKIGFELEDNNWNVWKLNRPLTHQERTSQQINRGDVTETDKVPLNKGDVLHVGNRFELQVDESGNKSDLEFVTSAFDEEDEKGLTTAMDNMIQVHDDIATEAKNHAWQDRFIWGQNHLNLNPPNINQPLLLTGLRIPKYKMQATAGIDIKEIAQLMEAIGKPQDDENWRESSLRQEGRQILQSQYTAGRIMGAAPPLAQQGINTFLNKYQNNLDPEISPGVQSIQQDSAALKSILSLMNMYITMAGEMKQLSYPKAIAPLMSRTRFPKLFQMLPQTVQKMFSQDDGKLWREIMKESLVPEFQTLSEPLFTVATFDDEEMFRDITRQVWIDGIPKGKDLLTIEDYKKWQDDQLAQWTEDHPIANMFKRSKKVNEAKRKKGHAEWLESFGSYGDKTEKVGPNEETEAALFELRGMWNKDDQAQKGKVTMEEAKETALKLQKYISRINRHQDLYFGE